MRICVFNINADMLWGTRYLAIVGDAKIRQNYLLNSRLLNVENVQSLLQFCLLMVFYLISIMNK